MQWAGLNQETGQATVDVQLPLAGQYASVLVHLKHDGSYQVHEAKQPRLPIQGDVWTAPDGVPMEIVDVEHLYEGTGPELCLRQILVTLKVEG